MRVTTMMMMDEEEEDEEEDKAEAGSCVCVWHAM
jgi:hypothetical protein